MDISNSYVYISNRALKYVPKELHIYIHTQIHMYVYECMCVCTHTLTHTPLILLLSKNYVLKMKYESETVIKSKKIGCKSMSFNVAYG